MSIKKNSTPNSKQESKTTTKAIDSRQTGTTALVEIKSPKRANGVKSTSKTKNTAEKSNETLTQIIIKYDVGFDNHLYLRGKNANLSWEKGIKLKNTKADEWAYETKKPIKKLEFKVLINDEEYEIGPNHSISQGALYYYSPRFN